MIRRNDWPLDLDHSDYPDANARAAALAKVGPFPRRMMIVTSVLVIVVVVIYFGGLWLFPQISQWILLVAALIVGFVVQYRGDKWHADGAQRWLTDLDATYHDFAPRGHANAD